MKKPPSKKEQAMAILRERLTEWTRRRELLAEISKQLDCSDFVVMRAASELGVSSRILRREDRTGDATFLHEWKIEE